MADAIDTPSAPAPDAPSESLADHEASYAPGVERRADPAEPAEPPAEPAAEPEAEATDAERDETGKFKPRHRAKSQQASPEDVPRIRELTRKLRETEAQLEAARRPAPAAAAPATPARQEPAPQPKPVGFPPFEQWLTQDGNESKTFEEFMDARADWRYDQRRTAEKADEARTAAERAFQTEADAYLKQLDEVSEEFPDFEDVVNPPDGPIRVSKVVERAVIKVGPRAAYYLATHPEERDALSEETAIDPNNPAFAATVAATRRYLSTLVASPQRATSSRAAAASTGSALALAPKPAPRPPNPVRTAALRDGDAMPTDENSLADHERAFGPGRRRA